MVEAGADTRIRFPDDYPDKRKAEERDQDKRAACRQAASLTGSPREDAFRRELLFAIQRRREGREDLVQFEVITDEQGEDIAVARGELLVREDVRADEKTWEMLSRFEFDVAPVDCLGGKVLRLANPDIAGERLADIARLVRHQGHQASVNHITPLGPVIKGRGGPEPSGGKRPFPPDFVASAGETRPIRVAVIDTGIADQERSDGWLQKLVRDHNVDPLDALPGQGDGFLDFGAGHGTFVAGVVQQVAPSAELALYRAVDSDGIGSEVDVACAMMRAVEEGAIILNLSLGAETLDDQPLLAVEVALELIEQANPEVLVVAAAGNFGSTRPSWPAAFRRVLSVAGLTAALGPTDWSSRGFWVDCSTVGEGVFSPYVRGEESTELDPEPDSFPDDAWAVWTGTSFAAPQYTGAVARLCQEEGWSPRQALQRLLAGARHIPDFGRVVEILPGT